MVINKIMMIRIYQVGLGSNLNKVCCSLYAAPIIQVVIKIDILKNNCTPPSYGVTQFRNGQSIR